MAGVRERGRRGEEEGLCSHTEEWGESGAEGTVGNGERTPGGSRSREGNDLERQARRQRRQRREPAKTTTRSKSKTSTAPPRGLLTTRAGGKVGERGAPLPLHTLITSSLLSLVSSLCEAIVAHASRRRGRPIFFFTFHLPSSPLHSMSTKPRAALHISVARQQSFSHSSSRRSSAPHNFHALLTARVTLRSHAETHTHTPRRTDTDTHIHTHTRTLYLALFLVIPLRHEHHNLGVRADVSSLHSLCFLVRSVLSLFAMPQTLPPATPHPCACGCIRRP